LTCGASSSSPSDSQFPPHGRTSEHRQQLKDADPRVSQEEAAFTTGRAVATAGGGNFPPIKESGHMYEETMSFCRAAKWRTKSKPKQSCSKSSSEQTAIASFTNKTPKELASFTIQFLVGDKRSESPPSRRKRKQKETRPTARDGRDYEWKNKTCGEKGMRKNLDNPKKKKKKKLFSSGSWNQATDPGGWGEGLQKPYLAEETRTKTKGKKLFLRTFYEIQGCARQ
jgi:hypothetical protein